ncbi:MAG: gluconate 2-dehydrogenase subunit 3 family protein, partial [Verrucomicrobiae bacterium]|nr:gluconate 2-dehydrogenase subunit 3 family protein [Verrucomicrobiae bacterium]
MSDPNNFPRMDRRTALKWISTAAATVPSIQSFSLSAEKSSGATRGIKAKGYGPDPDLLKIYKPGDLWPLTFTEEQRRLVIALCDIIMPADDQSPSASS